MNRYSANINIQLGGSRELKSVSQPQTEDNGNQQLALPKSFVKGSDCRIYKFGERGCGLRSYGEAQDFDKLRQACLSENKLFEDPQFPAIPSSIDPCKPVPREIKWMRPRELAPDPQLFVEGASRFDLNQGRLGDCWLVAALASITLNKSLLDILIPDDQGFDQSYAGIFHFRLWQYGRWIDVVIDDRLPTMDGELLYLRSNDSNEFWSALLEKAYAKLHGSFANLIGGHPVEAMVDFTGGISERFDEDEFPYDLYKILLKAYEQSALMCCSVQGRVEAMTSSGLVTGHAYTITKVQYLDVTTPRMSGKVPLIRLRNPWGNYVEWNGPWSDKSPEWRLISESRRREIGLTFDNDGEFWMSYKDFKANFGTIQICHLNPHLICQSSNLMNSRRKWKLSLFDGEWVRGVTAGGNINNRSTYAHNPQYRITLDAADEDDEQGYCNIIVELHQKNRRLRRARDHCLSIGFSVYKLSDPCPLKKPLDYSYLRRNYLNECCTPYTNLRDVSKRLRLSPGVYCVVPSTFNAGEEGEFVLRVFSECENHLQENDTEIGMENLHDGFQLEEQIAGDLKNLFINISGNDKEIDWMELKEVLDQRWRNENNGQQFSKDVCRSMIAMMDFDRSGKLGYEEFKYLLKDITHWTKIFKAHDIGTSGQLGGLELRQALTAAGYKVNGSILNMMMHRFATKSGMISFEDFLMCAAKLKNIIGLFHQKDVEGKGQVSFATEELVLATLYC